MLGKLKDKLMAGASRMQGRTDLLEAVCAAAALVAMADGSIDDSEVEATLVAVAANPTLASAFKQAEIERTMNSMLDRAQGGRAGRMGLYKEIDDVAGDTADGEIVLLTALDIADADGNMDDDEKEVIAKIGKRVGLDPSKYDI